MGAVAEGLIAKLDAAGLTAEEKIVLALATTGALNDEDDVQGFKLGNFEIQQMKHLEAQDRMGNFEIQDLRSSFNQSETRASSLFGGTSFGK